MLHSPTRFLSQVATEAINQQWWGPASPMLGLWAAEPVQASHFHLSPSPAAQIEDGYGGGTSHPNPGSHEDLVSLLVVTHELCNWAQPPCKEGPGTVTVPFLGRKIAAGFNPLIPTSASLTAFSFSMCICTWMQKDDQRKPAVGGCTFSKFCHFSIPLPASPSLHPLALPLCQGATHREAKWKREITRGKTVLIKRNREDKQLRVVWAGVTFFLILIILRLFAQ